MLKLKNESVSTDIILHYFQTWFNYHCEWHRETDIDFFDEMSQLYHRMFIECSDYLFEHAFEEYFEGHQFTGSHSPRFLSLIDDMEDSDFLQISVLTIFRGIITGATDYWAIEPSYRKDPCPAYSVMNLKYRKECIQHLLTKVFKGDEDYLVNRFAQQRMMYEVLD